MLWLLLLVGCPDPDTPVLDTDTDTQLAVDTDVDTDAADPWPATLSATGLYTDITTGELAPDVLTYQPAFPLWTDGSDKERFFALPEGTVIDTVDPDFWNFPVGTRAWKTFSRDGVRVETRYLERLEDDWLWISYQWRDDGSDADPVPDGVVDANGTDHDIPFEGACFRCHQAVGMLGVGAVQLGEDNPDNTLVTWSEAGMFTDPVPQDTRVPGEGLEHDVLGYLHGNCGGCHNDRYFLADSFALRMRVNVGTPTVHETGLYQTALNAPTQHQGTAPVIVAPGNPDASMMIERMSTREVTQMPPLGTELIDHVALDDVRAWISSLPSD